MKTGDGSFPSVIGVKTMCVICEAIISVIISPVILRADRGWT